MTTPPDATLTISARVTLADFRRYDSTREDPNFSAIDADQYIVWLNHQHPGRTYRLPTSQEYDDFNLNIATWEWTSDVEDPHRVVRGGSFYGGHSMRAALRYRRYPDDRYDVIGFRVVVFLRNAELPGENRSR